MSVIGLYNLKGGVGKTAAAVNLSYLAADRGERVLLWDLDPQGASSFYLGSQRGSSASMKKLLSGKVSIRDSIQDTAYGNLYLLPSRFSNRKTDILLDRIKKPGKRFSKIFTPVKKDFSWIFLDCPANISRVSENIFRYVDYLLVPIIPTTLSLRTYESLIAFFLSKRLNRELIIPFFSMVEKRKKMHREIMEMLWLRDGRILKNVIPYLSDIEKMGLYRKPLLAFRRNSPAAEAYKSLWDELLTVT